MKVRGAFRFSDNPWCRTLDASFAPRRRGRVTTRRRHGRATTLVEEPLIRDEDVSGGVYAHVVFIDDKDVRAAALTTPLLPIAERLPVAEALNALLDAPHFHDEECHVWRPVPAEWRLLTHRYGRDCVMLFTPLWRARNRSRLREVMIEPELRSLGFNDRVHPIHRFLGESPIAIHARNAAVVKRVLKMRYIAA